MSKRIGAVIIVAGALFLLSALALFLHNQAEDHTAGQQAQERLETLQTAMRQQEDGQPQEGQIPVSAQEQAGIELDGERYIGYLSIPAQELELPVMSDWDYEKLKSAPCRQFGAAKTNDLVIAAHNYKQHFARLADLKKGDEVLFYEVDGTVHVYAVAQVHTLKPIEVDRVKNSAWDLVLYTCTYGGKARIAAFCNRIQENHER